MSAASIIAVGRRAAETLMTCTCTVARISDGEWDESLLDNVELDTVIYTGPCRLKFASHRVTARAAESQVLALQQLLLYLPILGASGDILVGDVVTITDGGIDPALTGRKYRVTGLFSQTYATARRIPVESLT